MTNRFLRGVVTKGTIPVKLNQDVISFKANERGFVILNFRDQYNLQSNVPYPPGNLKNIDFHFIY